MTGTWMAASVAAALAGAATTPRLTILGLRQLARSDAAHRGLRLMSAIAGGSAAATAMVASHRAGTWWLAPALLVWGCALVATVCCDAVTQRIPTPLVRQAGVATGMLLFLGSAAHGDWWGLVISGAAAAASGFTLLLCWRFAGAGFGDVRLAVLGGLGLGHATHRGLVAAMVAFALVTLVQAAVVRARGGNRHTTFPYGPGLAIGFLLAAAL